jgi:hypothetical protein
MANPNAIATGLSYIKKEVDNTTSPPNTVSGVAAHCEGRRMPMADLPPKSLNRVGDRSVYLTMGPT